jgi:hypothetical protein
MLKKLQLKMAENKAGDDNSVTRSALHYVIHFDDIEKTNNVIWPPIRQAHGPEQGRRADMRGFTWSSRAATKAWNTES